MTEIVGVKTTGIYCLSSMCSGRPKPSNARRFTTAAAAEAAGLRPCHMCRPYRQDLMSTWVGTELICRAIRTILDGALHGGTEEELGAVLGVSARHLRRRFIEEVGVTPSQLARSSRAHFARRLIDDTDLTMTEIAFASGFGSVRQFNRTMSEIFREPPSKLRNRRRRTDRLVADGGLVVRMPHHPPLDIGVMMTSLRNQEIPGVESVSGGWYRRTVTIGNHAGVIEIGPGDIDDDLLLRLHLPHWEGLIHHVRRARRIVGLDHDHLTDGIRSRDAAVCRPGSVEVVPGTWDPFENSVREIVDRYHPKGPTEAVMGSLVSHLGEFVPGLGVLGLTHLFPTPRSLMRADELDIGLSRQGAAALSRFARSVENGSVKLDTIPA
ncbi:MAG: helix-turn-helix domain-containing protein [Acidimicrobiia bacterium]|nr:helix-turn-helix domain-containing protein [Acidimicrobiia bacterium]